MRKLIKVNGDETEIDSPKTVFEIAKLIGCNTIDTVLVRLDDREHVMIVDDEGLIDGKPRNEKATAIYSEKCGGPVNHYIAGDVVIAPDEDFA